MATTLLDLWKAKFSGGAEGGTISSANYYSEVPSDSLNQLMSENKHLNNTQTNVYTQTSQYKDNANLGPLSSQQFIDSVRGAQTAGLDTPENTSDDEYETINGVRSRTIAAYWKHYNNGGQHLTPDNPDTSEVNELDADVALQFTELTNLRNEYQGYQTRAVTEYKDLFKTS